MAKTIWNGLEAPDIDSQRLELEELVQQGVLTPEMAESYMQEASGMGGVSTDPRLKQAQMSALSKLEEVGSSGGMTLMDQANLNKIQTDLRANEKGQRDAILQNMNQRGMGGSGMELLAQLQNQSSSADRASAEGMNTAAVAQQRALDAIMQSGQLGGSIRGQEFDEQAQKAKAQDIINQFNTQNRQNTQNMNVGTRNAAQATNQTVKQDVANQNVGIRNQQQVNNKGLGQQQFQNNLSLQGGLAGDRAAAQRNKEYIETRDRNDDKDNLNNIGQGVGAAMSIAAMFSDERMKKDVESISLEDFLDSLAPKSFNYKDKKHGAGKHFGVMAQDLEKSEVGSSMVFDTPEGKAVDTGKASMTALAALSEINERLKKLEGK